MRKHHVKEMLTEDAVNERIRELGEKISEDYAGQEMRAGQENFRAGVH